MNFKNFFFLSFLILLISCNSSKKTDDDVVFVQGVIVRVETIFKYSNKFDFVYTYLYYLSRNEPLIGIEKNSKLVFVENEPVIISVLKNDSLNSFIEGRGVIDKIEISTYFEEINKN